jgi:hypothetical protein
MRAGDDGGELTEREVMASEGSRVEKVMAVGTRVGVETDRDEGGRDKVDKGVDLETCRLVDSCAGCS